MSAAPVVLVLPADWREQVAEIVRGELARYAERQDAAHHPLSAHEAAALYCGGSLARWRNLRHSYPVIDERAALGAPGRLRRWDPKRLAAVMAELKPSLRRQRRVQAGGVDPR